MTTKQKVVLGLVIAFGFFVIFVFVPYIVYTNPIEIVDDNSTEIVDDVERCLMCNSTEVFGEGFTRLYITEWDETGYHVAPYRKIPVLACNNCGAIRLDFTRMNRGQTALEDLSVRPEDFK